MSTPAEIANDATAEADVLRTEVADLLQQLEEANAVIDKVRGIGRYVAARKAEHYERWNDTDSMRDCDLYGAYADLQYRLNKVDGL